MLKRRIKRLLGNTLGHFRYYGTRVFFPPGSPTFGAAVDDGVYEYQCTKLVTALVAPRSTYFDVGANIGLMSIPVLHGCPTCQVVSFEPSPTTLACLKRTCAGSPFTDRWTVIGLGVGDTSGATEFHMAVKGGAFDGLRPTGSAGGTTTVQIQITTLDTVWHSLKDPDISFIKIDVEGAEMAVLRGGRECITAKRPHILLEWYASHLESYGVPITSLLDFAKDFDYQLFTAAEGIEIKDANMLRLQMLRDFSFLLAPEPR